MQLTLPDVPPLLVSTKLRAPCGIANINDFSLNPELEKPPRLPSHFCEDQQSFPGMQTALHTLHTLHTQGCTALRRADPTPYLFPGGTVEEVVDGLQISPQGATWPSCRWLRNIHCACGACGGVDTMPTRACSTWGRAHTQERLAWDPTSLH